MKKIFIVLTALLLTASIVMAQEEKEAGSEDITKEKVEKKAEEVVNEKIEKQTKSKSAKEYIADLSNNDEETIVTAANWLGKKEEKAAVPELIKLLKNDKRVRVRMHVTIALGLIGDETSIPALNEALLSDQNADVRYSVLLAIHRIDPSKSIDALQKAKESESDPYIKDYIEKMEAKWREK